MTTFGWLPIILFVGIVIFLIFCGLIVVNKKDITGLKFGKLTVFGKIKSLDGGRLRWECLCDCGVIISARSDCLRSGKTKSCGCLRRELNMRHGMKKHPFYEIWFNMKKRAKKRGIKVGFDSISEAYSYMISIGWEKGLAVCRGTKENPDQGNYEIGNIYIDTRGNNIRDYLRTKLDSKK